jgi:polysaccharide biosynthesis protein PslH
VNILFLTTVLPGKKRNGGEVSSSCFIEGLIENGHQLLILGYTPKGSSYQPQPNEISIGERYIETESAKYYPLMWMLSSYITGLPYSAQKYYSKAYVNKATEIVARSHYDVVIIDHAQLAWLDKISLPQGTKVILNSHNIEQDIYQAQVKKATNPILKQIYQREARLVKAMEDRLAAKADGVWTLTATDAAYFATVISRDVPEKQLRHKSRVFSLPGNVMDLADRVETPSYDVGMLGTWTWQPNKEGLEWFFESIYPQLPTTLSICIAGKGAEWINDRYPNVRYRGFVLDPEAFLAAAKVVAIPSIGGGGIQLKTIKAIASGALTIATPDALRGIDDCPNFVRIASTPADFASQLTELVTSPHHEDRRQEGIEWAQQRRKRFYQEIGAAVSFD